MYDRDRNNSGGVAALIGLTAFLLYFASNLLVLYGSRIREYYADQGSVEFGNPPHHLASALYKLVYGSAKYRGQTELRRIEGVRAFFLNDPAKAKDELMELAQVDKDMSGTIDGTELMELRQKTVKISAAEKMMELFTTHPNMLKRIKHLSALA
jgi:heat shock protein HtpX